MDGPAEQTEAGTPDSDGSPHDTSTLPIFTLSDLIYLDDYSPERIDSPFNSPAIFFPCVPARHCPPDPPADPPQPNPDRAFLLACLPEDTLLDTELPKHDKSRLENEYYASRDILNDTNLPHDSHKRVQARKRLVAISDIVVEQFEVALQEEETMLAESEQWVKRTPEMGVHVPLDDWRTLDESFERLWEGKREKWRELEGLKARHAWLQEEFANADWTIDPRLLVKELDPEPAEHAPLGDWGYPYDFPDEEVEEQEVELVNLFTGQTVKPYPPGSWEVSAPAFPPWEEGTMDLLAMQHAAFPCRERVRKKNDPATWRAYTRFSGAGVRDSHLAVIREEVVESDDDDDVMMVMMMMMRRRRRRPRSSEKEGQRRVMCGVRRMKTRTRTETETEIDTKTGMETRTNPLMSDPWKRVRISPPRRGRLRVMNPDDEPPADMMVESESQQAETGVQDGEMLGGKEVRPEFDWMVREIEDDELMVRGGSERARTDKTTEVDARYDT
ncbi:hypothetical protein B0A55_01889 [Friedmanniomyces simplex]|uniref:Uncharacterized protein n=1 Tax=Friedmanniomyces simplex TaxID=329884 RepID=A0A4U0XYX9_9PEZI|nr:hypothetical protein B0A55_01889 [Friedmanniomyces simplex]